MNSQRVVLLMAGLSTGALAAVLWGGTAGLALAVALMLAQVVAVAMQLRRREAAVASRAEPLPPVDYTVFSIGDETMPYLRQGLNFESAQKITDIILRITEVDAVAITDTEKILGFSGVGCRRHHQGGPILTQGTRRVLKSGRTKVVNDATILSCSEPDCPHPLRSAVITPLGLRGKVVGTFKLYRTSPHPMPHHLWALAEGIAQILGLQIELGEADRQRQLITKARLEALQAQIRPHFLFNVLNTIIMFSRTDVEKARELLIQLASFFRRSLSYRGHFITLQDEIEYINTYLALEQARFGDNLTVRLRIDPQCLPHKVPILTVQPLVENAVVHGIAPKEGGGMVAVSVRKSAGEVRVTIMDNGVGMDKERVRRIFEDGFGTGMGLGMTNVNDRLISLYGEHARLRVKSRPAWGTAIRVRIPLDTVPENLVSPEVDDAVSRVETANVAASGKAEGGAAPSTRSA